MRKSCFFQNYQSSGIALSSESLLGGIRYTACARIGGSRPVVLAQAKNPEFETATRCEEVYTGIRVLSLSIQSRFV